MVRKIFLVLFIGVLIAYFWPKDRFLGCGSILCRQEDKQRIEKEKSDLVCLGFKTGLNVTDVDGVRCYGIFIVK